MSGPYFNTILFSKVTLQPHQFDTRIIDNIKNNLIQEWQGKCYFGFGLIMSINTVDLGDDPENEIPVNDPSSNAIYNVKFNATICNPIIGSIIVAEIFDINEKMIVAREKKMVFLILNGKYNREKIVFNYNKSAYMPIDSNKKEIPQPIVKGTMVNVRVDKKSLVQKATEILIIGYLDSVVSKEDLKNDEKKENVYEDEYDDNGRLVSNIDNSQPIHMVKKNISKENEENEENEESDEDSNKDSDKDSDEDSDENEYDNNKNSHKRKSRSMKKKTEKNEDVFAKKKSSTSVKFKKQLKKESTKSDKTINIKAGKKI